MSGKNREKMHLRALRDLRLPAVPHLLNILQPASGIMHSGPRPMGDILDTHFNSRTDIAPGSTSLPMPAVKTQAYF